MPKSRRNKKSGGRVVRMSAKVTAAMRRQLKAFEKKFGRPPGPNDPVFFDHDKDEPTGYDPEADILAAMHKANLPPEFAYAYRKTGLLGLHPDKSRWPQEHIDEWEAALREYRLIQEAQKRPDRPDPEKWDTQIPELLL